VVLLNRVVLMTGCWPAPETTANMNTRFSGNLGLSDTEEDAIVAFLGTLSDGWKSE
jgi:cytochrome c peroxidase